MLHENHKYLTILHIYMGLLAYWESHAGYVDLLPEWSDYKLHEAIERAWDTRKNMKRSGGSSAVGEAQPSFSL